MSVIKFDGSVTSEALVQMVKDMGFTPETHPHLFRDMVRGFKEAMAHAGVSMDDRISVSWTFDENGVTGATVERKN